VIASRAMLFGNLGQLLGKDRSKVRLPKLGVGEPDGHADGERNQGRGTRAPARFLFLAAVRFAATVPTWTRVVMILAPWLG